MEIIQGEFLSGGRWYTSTTKTKQQLREKSLQNKQGYTISKLAHSEEKRQNVEGMVKKYEEREKDHAHLDKERDTKEAALAASEAKENERLEQRGERCVTSRKKNEDERKLLKNEHQVEIVAVWKEKESEIKKVTVKARVKVAALKKKADARADQSSHHSTRAPQKRKGVFVYLCFLDGALE